MESFEASKPHHYQPVTAVYAGKSIFVTGGSGFLGKVFLEKVIYSCPEISRIYVLIRESSKATVDKRIQDIISVPLFSRLQRERPQDLNKIIPIPGDIALPKLGLKPEHEETLLNEVSMVFHIAATVKFNDSLQNALKINVIGTKHLLELTKQIRKIEAFIYVSTVFSNPHLEVIEEIVYPPSISLEEADQLEQRSCISEKETLKIIGKSFNTYTFSKGLAEYYVQKYHGDVPTAIIRPSIVVASKAEPFEGWVDTWMGAAGILSSIGLGLNRVIVTNSKHVIDLIPVDYVSNATIVIAAKLKRSKKVVVYNICTSTKSPILIGNFMDLFRNHFIKYKMNILPFPTTVYTLSKWLVDIITCCEKLCASLIDSFLFCIGVKPRFTKLQARIVKERNVIAPFTRRTWTIIAENTCELFESLSCTDRKCFDFDLRNIKWQELIHNYVLGVKKYLYKSNKH